MKPDLRFAPFNSGDVGKYERDKLDHVLVSQASRGAAQHGRGLSAIPLQVLLSERGQVKARHRVLTAQLRRLQRDTPEWRSLVDEIDSLNARLGDFKGLIIEAQRREGGSFAHQLNAINAKLDRILVLLDEPHRNAARPEAAEGSKP